jgi:hypothetical protein
MGLDFATCDKCDYPFYDGTSYSYCKKCSNLLCEECTEDLEIENHEMSKEECPFCNLHEVTDTMVLDFLLEINDITKEEAIEDMRKMAGK